MATESQTDFSGGLNTRSPAHLLASNQLTELQNVDLSHSDLRGEYGTKAGGQTEFYYEAASAWVSATGFSGEETILDWPSAYSTDVGSPTTTTISADTNYFTGSPNAKIGNNVTLRIGPAPNGEVNITVVLVPKTQGIHGANSYVEYNDDLYIARDSFTVTADATDASDVLDTGADTNKLQVGDELVNTAYVNTGTYIKSVNTANDTVLISDPAIATASGQTFTVNAIISKYVDGATDTSYRAGVNAPLPVIEYEKKAGNYITGRDGSHTDAWYGATDPIPFQYGLAEYDETGVESTMGKMTDSNTGTVGGGNFTTASGDVDEPQYISISGVDRYTTAIPTKGRFALYRVGGTSAFIKRCDNLYLDDLEVSTAKSTSPNKLTISLNTAKDAYKYKVKWYSYNQGSSAAYRYYNSSTGYVFPFDATPGPGTVTSVASGTSSKMIFTSASHGLFNGDYVQLSTTGAFPEISSGTHLATSTNYYIKDKTSDTFYISASSGGTNLDYYSAGSGTLTWDSPVVRAFSGETEYKNPSSNTLAFELDASGTTHFTDIFVLMKIPGETVEREYVCRAITHANADAITTTGVDYIDFNRADALVDIQPVEEVTTPARNLTGLIESSNLFYAFKDNRLQVSKYGDPNSWPQSGFIDFDQNITGLGTLGSELVVFTEYGMYRVFGTDPSLLKKVQIPTTEGVKSGARKTITQFQSGVFFAGLNGICFYNGQAVRRITQDNLSTFSLPDSTVANNHGGYLEDTYYLLGTSGTGYKIDVKGQAILSRTTQNASSLFFRASDNTLYGDTGQISNPTGTRQAFTATTRKFAGSDINMEKIFYSITLTGESFTGTINFLVDGTQTDTFSVGSAVADLDRTFYLSAPRAGNGAQVQLSSCTGIVSKISVNYDSSETLAEALYTSVKIKYVGTPTVSVSLDGVANISATTLSAPTGAVGEATLYFTAMSTGVVPHLIETNNEASGRVLEFTYESTRI